jgi:hypothetical protein
MQLPVHHVPTAFSNLLKEPTMSTTSTSRTRRLVRRITATLADMSYAQRRLLEINTELDDTTEGRTRRAA